MYTVTFCASDHDFELTVAVIVTAVGAATVPAVIVNVPVNAPFATVIFDGTLAAEGLLLVNDTDTAAVLEAMLTETVPVPLLPTLIVIGLIVRADTSGPIHPEAELHGHRRSDCSFAGCEREKFHRARSIRRWR